MICDKKIGICHIHGGAWSYKCEACWYHLDNKSCIWARLEAWVLGIRFGYIGD
jgi:hypothetical protein